MDRFAKETGRAYRLFDYYGAPDAERVIVMMGSGAEAAEEAVDADEQAGRKGGHGQGSPLPALRLEAFLTALPATVKTIAVLDRARSRAPRASRFIMDIVTVLAENAATLPFAAKPTVIGGRYGLSSKEFTPAMVKGIFDELKKPAAEEPLHHRH